MNINFGLFPDLAYTNSPGGKKPPRGKDRKQAMAQRALDDLANWLQPERAAAE